MMVKNSDATLRPQDVHKILHAHYVLRVALDHLPAEDIYRLYETFHQQNINKPLVITFTSFADGSGFIGSRAGEQLLHRYICNNPMRFYFMTPAQLKNVNEKESRYAELLCIGGHSKKEQINSLMLAAPIPRLTNVETKTNHTAYNKPI